MIKLKKAYNLKIMFVAIGVLCLFGNALYPCAISRNSLRVPIGQGGIYKSIKKEQVIKKIEHLLSNSDYTLKELKNKFKNDKEPRLLIICGNDDTRTIQEAAKLYEEGIVDYIFTTGGHARFTVSLIEKIVLEHGSAKISKSETITKKNLKKVLPELWELYNQGRLGERVTLSEAELTKDVLVERFNVSKQAVFSEKLSRNTSQNFIYVKKDIVELEEKMGINFKTIFYIQIPHQQLRAKFTFNKAFKEEIRSGKVKGLSHTAKYDRSMLDQKELIKILIGEIWRIVIYSAKGDLIDFDKKDNNVQAWRTIAQDYWQFVNILVQEHGDVDDLRDFLYSLAKVAGYENRKDLIDGLDGSIFPEVKKLIAWVYKAGTSKTDKSVDDIMSGYKKNMISKIDRGMQEFNLGKKISVSWTPGGTIKSSKPAIKTSKGNISIKKLNRIESEDDVKFIIDYICHLRRDGLSTLILNKPNTQGKLMQDFLIIERHPETGEIEYWYVERWSENRAILREDALPETIRAVGRFLGIMHNSSRTFRSTVQRHPDHYTFKQALNLLLSPDATWYKILDSYLSNNERRLVKACLSEIRRFWTSALLNQLSYQAIPSDMNFGNLFFNDKGDEVLDIIDLDNVRMGYKIEDFFGSLVHTGHETLYVGNLRKDLAEFLAGYNETAEVKLTQSELRALPILFITIPMIHIAYTISLELEVDLEKSVQANIQTLKEIIEQFSNESIQPSIAPLINLKKILTNT
ncbi:MAG: ElyC/SanA/YdcF family protein [Candidatus Gorgyraea atricola]|nr:ElyC/SanA/YdcF family protein [Candidatus Gorgyraea atricola]